MADRDTIIFLNVIENTVNSIRGDGSDMKTLFTAHCTCPDGISLDLNSYRKSRDPQDIVVWWSNMGEKKVVEGEKDGGDWHAPDGYPVRANLYGGDAAAERVEVKPSRRLIRGGAVYEPPQHRPLITTMKQTALTQDGQSLFFCDREGHCVQKYNVQTKEVVPIVSADALAALADGISEEEGLATPVPPNSDADKRRMCVGIALDEKHNQLFFTIKGPSKGGKGRILAAPYHFNRRNLPSLAAATSSKAEGVVDPHSVVTLHDNLPEPIDLLLDAEEGFLYWTDRGDDAMGGNSLNRSSVTYDHRTGRPQLGKVEILIRGFDETIGLTWPASHVKRALISSENDPSLRQYMYVSGQGHLWRCDMQARTKTVIYDSPDKTMLTGVEAVRLE